MIPTQVFIFIFIGACFCFAEAALRKNQRNSSSSLSRRLKFNTCSVLKSFIEYENDNKESALHSKKEICSCEIEDGAILELENLEEKICSELVSSESVITSSSGFDLNEATQVASIPFEATLATTTVTMENLAPPSCGSGREICIDYSCHCC